ncbi:hypothetical protein IVB22_09045 [Bradyrhizobium sp. 190]|nr:hypothetical protein [Bradyrhizobium sp. 190]
MRKLLSVWIVLAAIVGANVTALPQCIGMGMGPGPGMVHSTGGGGGSLTRNANVTAVQALGEAQKSVKAGKRFKPREFRQGHH